MGCCSLFELVGLMLLGIRGDRFLLNLGGRERGVRVERTLRDAAALDLRKKDSSDECPPSDISAGRQARGRGG